MSTVMPVSPSDWLSLWWNGRRDGLHQLPAWVSDSSEPPSTPHLVALSNQAQALFENERLALAAASLKLDQKSADLQARGATLKRQLAELLEADAAPQPLSPAARERRRTGEAELDIAVIRRRRQSEHDRVVARYEGRVNQLSEALARVEAELEIVPAELENLRHQTVVRVQKIRHLTARRAAFYWRALARKHPRGASLAAAWRHLATDPPEWAELTHVGAP